MDGERFAAALESGSLAELEQIPKSDLHSHAGRGGRISFVEEYAHVAIAPPQQPFESLAEMNGWFAAQVKRHLPSGAEGYRLRLEAAFWQAAADRIRVLALSFAMDEVETLGGMPGFIRAVDALRAAYAPDTAFYPDLSLGYAADEPRRLDAVLAYDWFRGVDICNYAGTFTLPQLSGMCQRAREAGLRVKAHIGEFGTADDVWRYAETLRLDEIQHGALAAKSPPLMAWLARSGIRLNLCPTSNVLMGVCADYASHPIRALFEHGVAVTVNTDDLMIFNATASQEYLRLHRAGMSARDLNTIRETGLAYPR